MFFTLLVWTLFFHEFSMYFSRFLMPWPPPGSRFYCRRVVKIKVFRILNQTCFGIVFSMFFNAKWLQKCSKNALVELPSPSKSHQHRKMGSKATPRGAKNQPRRAQVEQKVGIWRLLGSLGVALGALLLHLGSAWSIFCSSWGRFGPHLSMLVAFGWAWKLNKCIFRAFLEPFCIKKHWKNNAKTSLVQNSKTLDFYDASAVKTWSWRWSGHQKSRKNHWKFMKKQGSNK